MIQFSNLSLEGAWMMAIEYQGPTTLGLNSEKVPLLAGTDRQRMQKGAYVLSEDRDYRVTLVATGSDVWRAVEAAKMLQVDGTPCRTVSMPSMRRFDEQDEEYIRSIFPFDSRPVVSVEVGSTLGWAKYASAGIGQDQFGISMSPDVVFDHLNLTSRHIFLRVKEYLRKLEGKDARMQRWQIRRCHERAFPSATCF